MTTTTHDQTAKLGEILDQTGEPIRQVSRQTLDMIRSEGDQLVSCANDKIRKYPLPSVLGALAVGMAIGCLIGSGRNHSSPQERFMDEPLDLANHLGESVKNSLGQLYTHLKFW
jgi:ElaB/YqjD/DUF883 family membrane-anchored ribosome-binding protein